VVCRVPYMRFYGMDMTVTAVAAVVQNQVYAFGGIEYLDMRGVAHQLVHPCLFESYVADAEICLTVSEGYELLRDRVVGFRAGTFGNHADYREFVAGNGFREVTLGFQCDGNDRLFSFGLIAF